MGRAVAMLVLALVCASVSVSCKGSEDLTGVRMVVTPDFLTDPNSFGVTSNAVTLEKGAVDGERIVLDVVVTEVTTPVSGIAIKLTYPSEFSKFIRCTDGDLFVSGSCYFKEPSSGSGEVFIGRSLLAPEPPAPVSGSEVIARVEFLVFAEGEKAVVFEAQNLGAGDASALLDASGDPILVDWFAGILSGR